MSKKTVVALTALAFALGAGLALIVAVVVLRAPGRSGTLPPAVSKAENNARCPGCGHEFHLREGRGSMVEASRMHPCPNCGTRYPAATLWKRQ